MRKMAKHLLSKVHLDGFAVRLLLLFRRVKRNALAVDGAIIKRYLAEKKIRKLHIGCGEYRLRDWLNSDYSPVSELVLALDATRTFPFASETFDRIFSEHMIEHVSYPNGFSMLRECHRVLANNGKIRISTPDLQFLIDLHRDDKSELQREYIKWSTDSFIKEAPYSGDAFVINNYVRAWGHLFIYDESTLRTAMEKAGFTNIRKCEINESEDEMLRNLENETRLPKGFVKLESLILEGTRATSG